MDKTIRYVMEGRIWHEEYKGEIFKDEGETINNRSKSKGEEEMKEKQGRRRIK
jgi:hypothetical protein